MFLTRLRFFTQKSEGLYDYGFKEQSMFIRLRVYVYGWVFHGLLGCHLTTFISFLECRNT